MKYLPLLPVVAALFCSSLQCDGDCYPDFVVATQTQWASTPLHHVGAVPEPVTDGQPIPREAFGIRISCILDAHGEDSTAVTSACGIEYFVDTPAVAVRIITRLDFDAQHLAGQEVTDLFRCRLHGGLTSRDAPAALPKRINTGHSFTQYDSPQRAIDLLLLPMREVYADLLLITPPPGPQEVRFEVRLERRDGSVVTLLLPTQLLQ